MTQNYIFVFKEDTGHVTLYASAWKEKMEGRRAGRGPQSYNLLSCLLACYIYTGHGYVPPLANGTRRSLDVGRATS